MAKHKAKAGGHMSGKQKARQLKKGRRSKTDRFQPPQADGTKIRLNAKSKSRPRQQVF